MEAAHHRTTVDLPPSRRNDGLIAKRVLVVDDDDYIRDILATFIGGLNYHVDQAADGAEALSLFQTRHFDLVISDIQMPRMDGRRLMQALKALSPGIPVVLITGQTWNDARSDRVDSLAETILHKPFGLDALKGVLDRVFPYQESGRNP